MFFYLLSVSTSLHELGDWHAACALPFVGGWRCGGGGLRCSWRVSLRACGCLGFFTGLFSSSCGEVGPLAGHWKSLQAKTGQSVFVHIPAAASVGWTLLINSVFLHKALQLYSDERGKKKSHLNWSQKMYKNKMCSGCTSVQHIWLAVTSSSGNIQHVTRRVHILT